MYKFNKSIFAFCLVLGSVNGKGLQGFYIGADFGYSHSNIDLTLDDGRRSLIRVKTRNHLASPNLGLSFGYDHLLQNSMILGLEIFGDYNLGGKKEIASPKLGCTYTKIEAERKGPGLSILARIGTKISQSTALYAGIGFKSLKHTFIYQDAHEPTKYKFGKRRISPMAQVGFQRLLGNSKQWGWGASYSYVLGKKFTKTGLPHSKYTFMGDLDATISAKSSEHSVKVGTFYRF